MRERALSLWPLSILLISALLPFAIDPSGLRPFLPPKSVLLAVGAAVSAMLASSAWLLAYLWPEKRVADGDLDTGGSDAGGVGAGGVGAGGVGAGGRGAGGGGASGAGAGGARASRTPAAVRVDGWIVIPALLALGWLLLAPIPVATNRALHMLGAAELLAAGTLGALTIIAVRTNERWRSRLLGTMAITAVVMAIHALLQASGFDPLRVLTGVSSQAEGRWRAFTTTGNPNWTGAYLACTAPIAAWLARRRRVRGLEVVVWCVFAAAVLATGSRLALLALLAGAAFSWRSAAKQRIVPGSRSWFAAGIAAVAILILIAVALTAFGSELAARWGNTRSIGGRLVSFGAALHLIYDSPLAGHGLDHFALRLPDGLRQLHAQVGASWLDWWPRSLSAHVHNDFLETGVDAGVIGMLLLAFLWGMAVHRTRKVEPAVASSLLAMALLASASVPLQIPTTLLLFCLLTGISAVRPSVPEGAIVPPAVNVGGVPAAAESPRRAEWRVTGTSSTSTAGLRGSTIVMLAPRILLFVAALAATAASIELGGRVLSANRTAKHSRALLRAGDLEGTELVLREVLAATPWDHESGAILAAIEVDEGRPAAALGVVDAIDQWSASRGSWIVRAQALRAQQRERQAVEVLEAAVDALPDFLRAHYLLGELYAWLGRVEESRAAFERVINSPQTSPAAMTLKRSARDSLERVGNRPPRS
jgi:O-antigen ligase